MLFAKRALVGALGSTKAALRWRPRAAQVQLRARGGSDDGGKSAATLASLRKELETRGLAALVVPSDDPHLSEYVAACYERRAFVSGFTGSAGTAVITQSAALLWTDGRYWLQAEQELSDEWTLQKAGEKGVATPAEWFENAGLAAGAVVGIDAAVTSAALAANIRNSAAKAGLRVDRLETNPVDAVWGASRPAAPSEPLRVHALEYAGETAESKLERVRVALKAEGADALVVAALDDVCWLFNVRGADVACNPVGFSFALVTLDKTTIFVDGDKVPPAVAAHLAAAGASVEPYGAALSAVADFASGGGRVWLDPERVSDAFVGAVAEGQRFSKRSPISLMKALKNAAELSGMRAAHLRDGAAAARGFAELEEKVLAGESIDEVAVDEILSRRRAEDPLFLDLSFPTIAGAGANGAIIHYGAQAGSCSPVGRGMLLVDSGGQYADGTTDVTRTWHFGTPTPLETLAYTNVLKGNIGVDSAVFPENTPGFVLDAFARRALWASGQDYGHGTGHGVGAALSVHEGPHSISPRWGNLEPLCAGMVVSNEPGFYERGKFGIRIENLLTIEYADAEPPAAGKRFLRFKKLTHIPIDRTCIDVARLDATEIAWLDAYHAEVLSAIGPLVSDDARATAWLQKHCSKLVAA
ncbi:peptidase M24, structural domain-containing protein [Pelagophyceae sp. CCMP2097]|nr:peptidase M24, structural domain-containing protein [Pelagophyceae sp. CCMP2097]